MASAQREDHAGHLSLALDTTSSSSPFPSPGSSFLPPPVPRPHEFAMRPASGGRKMSSKEEDVGIGSRQPDVSTPYNASTNGTAANANVGDRAAESANSLNGVVSPTRATLSIIRSLLPGFMLSMLNVPRSLLGVLHLQETVMRALSDTSTIGYSGHRTPTPMSPIPTSTPHTPTELTYSRLLSSTEETEQNQTHSSQSQSHGGSDPSLFPPSPSVPCGSTHRMSTQSVTSLTSSRPAPPSPAMSRRASGMSRASSSARSRPVSGVSGSASRPVSGIPSGVRSRPVSGSLGPSSNGLSRTPSGRRAKEVLGMSSVVESREQAQSTEENVESKKEILIKIRDYAFLRSDPRFLGEGPDSPKENRPRKLAGLLGSRFSTSSEEVEEADEPDSDMNEWGGFKWGFARLQHGWDFGARGSIIGSGKEFPSQMDFERNFADGDEGEYDDDADVYDDAEDYADGDDEPDGEPELFPGLYRALYAFEPEGIAEMKLEEEQIVRVVGRGGGVGWAVVVKDGLVDSGMHALVPESYLEAVRLDGDEEEA